MNRHALRLTQRLGFEYCSDGRGTHPHLPVCEGRAGRAARSCRRRCPTLDELIGRGGITEDNVAAHLLERTRGRPRRRSRLHAARRPRGRCASRRCVRAAARRLAGPRAGRCGSTRRCSRRLQPMALPRCTVGPSERPGAGRQRCCVQGPEFLGDVDPRRGRLSAARRTANRHAQRFDPPTTPVPTERPRCPRDKRRRFLAARHRRRHVPAVRPRGQARRAVLLSEGQHARLHHRGPAVPRPARGVRQGRRRRLRRSRATASSRTRASRPRSGFPFALLSDEDEKPSARSSASSR